MSGPMTDKSVEEWNADYEADLRQEQEMTDKSVPETNEQTRIIKEACEWALADPGHKSAAAFRDVAQPVAILALIARVEQEQGAKRGLAEFADKQQATIEELREYIDAYEESSADSYRILISRINELREALKQNIEATCG